MQNKTNPSIFYAAALLKKGYDTINPCCQQSTDGDSQHPSGHQTLRNSPTHAESRFVAPTPIIAPVMVCVVLTGIFRYSVR